MPPQGRLVITIRDPELLNLVNSLSRVAKAKFVHLAIKRFLETKEGMDYLELWQKARATRSADSDLPVASARSGSALDKVMGDF